MDIWYVLEGIMEEILETTQLEAVDESTMQFKFADQVGPLDLLLFLIKKNKLEIVVRIINTVLMIAGFIVTFVMEYYYAFYIACFFACINTVIEKVINKRTNTKAFKKCLLGIVMAVLAVAVGILCK